MAQGTCSIKKCPNDAIARGWCSKHYAIWRRNGDPLAVTVIRGNNVARFWSKVDRRGDDECWPWLGALTHDGYARFRLGNSHVIASRWAYETFAAAVPADHEVDHVKANGCTRRDCTNYIRHLEPVTGLENLMRSENFVATNAAKTHCGTCGEPYDDENTIVRNGRRVCRRCEQGRSRRSREGRSAAGEAA